MLGTHIAAGLRPLRYDRAHHLPCSFGSHTLPHPAVSLFPDSIHPDIPAHKFLNSTITTALPSQSYCILLFFCLRLESPTPFCLRLRLSEPIPSQFPGVQADARADGAGQAAPACAVDVVCGPERAAKHKKSASAVCWHWVRVALRLGNIIINESLPILTISGGLAGVVLSTTAICKSHSGSPPAFLHPHSSDHQAVTRPARLPSYPLPASFISSLPHRGINPRHQTPQLFLGKHHSDRELQLAGEFFAKSTETVPPQPSRLTIFLFLSVVECVRGARLVGWLTAFANRPWLFLSSRILASNDYPPIPSPARVGVETLGGSAG
ncbi:hypothetical protein B0H14DRAFT_3615206 [Mycena olivaceomarginata]|nr:hypothetical protein B0H14DRAFT_3615206 [Mycena olivaceomarginata]